MPSWSVLGSLVAAMTVMSANSERSIRTRMSVTFRGHEVGANTYEMKTSGEFTSITDIDVLGNSIHSSISGACKGGQLIAYRLEQTMPGENVVATLERKRLTIRVGGKTRKSEMSDSIAARFEDFHPQLAGSVIAALGKDPAAELSTFVPSDGTFHTYRVQTMKDVTATVGRYRVAYTPYGITAERVTVWLALNAKREIIGERVGEDGFQFVLSGYEGLFGPIAASR